MKSENKPEVYSTLVVCCIVVLLTPKSINAQEVDNEREFDYGRKSEKGPRKWGSMKKEWSSCSNGTMQSPVDMSNKRVQIISGRGAPEKRLYKPANATLINRGHDIQIEWVGGGGSALINGSSFPLRYAHWHSPSEHSINGRRYDMELHLVHLNTDLNLKSTRNRIAVVGILYKIGRPDPFLSKLMPNIRSIIDQKNKESGLGMVDPNQIKMDSTRYYRYMGSLTVPPCTEGVIWTLNTKVKSVSREQVNLLREAVHDFAEENARPLQPHNNRDIYLYGPPLTN